MGRIYDRVSEEGVVREIYFEKNDLKFVVEGYELGEPDPSEECSEEVYAGEYFYHNFDSFKEAVEKFIELVDKGWETVRLSIYPKEDSGLHKTGVGFSFQYSKDYKRESTWSVVQVNINKISENYAKKLQKIQEILTRPEVE